MKISSVGVACFLPGRAKDLSAPLYVCIYICVCVCMCVSFNSHAFKM